MDYLEGEGVQVEPILVIDQNLTMKVCINSNVFNITCGKRRELWSSLQSIYPSITEFVDMGGVFNVIRNSEERLVVVIVANWSRSLAVDLCNFRMYMHWSF